MHRGRNEGNSLEHVADTSCSFCFACHKVKLQIEIDVSSAETKGRLSESMIKG